MSDYDFAFTAIGEKRPFWFYITRYLYKVINYQQSVITAYKLEFENTDPLSP